MSLSVTLSIIYNTCHSCTNSVLFILITVCSVVECLPIQESLELPQKESNSLLRDKTPNYGHVVQDASFRDKRGSHLGRKVSKD